MTWSDDWFVGRLTSTPHGRVFGETVGSTVRSARLVLVRFCAAPEELADQLTLNIELDATATRQLAAPAVCSSRFAPTTRRSMRRPRGHAALDNPGRDPMTGPRPERATSDQNAPPIEATPGVPTVDVAIPCYRYGHMLDTAVRSVLEQDGVAARILIIDDASPDDSAAAATAIAARDARISVRVHASNLGHIATFNEGVLDWASADYTLLLSADDALTPGALRRATDLLDAHPRVAFAYGAALSWSGTDPPPIARTGEPEWVVHGGDDWMRRCFLAGTNPIASPAVVVRTATQHRVGGYRSDLLHTSDLEMWLRLALHGDVGFLAGVDQALCRQHDANMSRTYEDAGAGLGDLRMRLAAFEVVEARIGDRRLPGSAALSRRLRRRLATDALLRVSRDYDKGRLITADHDELVDFARDTAPHVERLAAWHALRVRRLLGPRVTPLLRPLVLTAVGRRARQIWRDRRLAKAGV